MPMRVHGQSTSGVQTRSMEKAGFAPGRPAIKRPAADQSSPAPPLKQAKVDGKFSAGNGNPQIRASAEGSPNLNPGLRRSGAMRHEANSTHAMETRSKFAAPPSAGTRSHTAAAPTPPPRHESLQGGFNAIAMPKNNGAAIVSANTKGGAKLSKEESSYLSTGTPTKAMSKDIKDHTQQIGQVNGENKKQVPIGNEGSTISKECDKTLLRSNIFINGKACTIPPHLKTDEEKKTHMRQQLENAFRGPDGKVDQAALKNVSNVLHTALPARAQTASACGQGHNLLIQSAAVPGGTSFNIQQSKTDPKQWDVSFKSHQEVKGISKQESAGIMSKLRSGGAGNLPKTTPLAVPPEAKNLMLSGSVSVHSDAKGVGTFKADPSTWKSHFSA